MKRLHWWITGLLAAAWATAPAAETPPVRILTSFYPMYIATLNVAGGVEGVEVSNLTRPFTGCLHDYQLTPADLKTISQAGIFVVNGAGMESFLQKALDQAPHLKIVEASQGIALLRSEGGDEENAHVWVSISDHLRQIENIARGLAEADPAHAEAYGKNAQAYIARLEDLRKRMQAGLADLRTRDIITFHEAFPYFAREFNLNIVDIIEREPGSEPSAQELAATIRQIRQAQRKVLFAEPQYPSRAADMIARETGATVYTLDPAVTGPLEKEAYLKIMERNLQELEKALK